MSRATDGIRSRLKQGWTSVNGGLPGVTHDLRRAVARSHPRFATAVLADARLAAERRGERHIYRSRLDAGVQVIRLMLVTDAFLGQVCYRAKAACQARGIPLLPRLFHRLAMVTGQICIGDPASIEPGVYIPHGQVVIGGFTTVRSGVSLLPFVTLGVRGRMAGPTVGRGATIGTGAKVLGAVKVGALASVGANAVVLDDVPAWATAVGVPASVVAAPGG